MKSKTNNNNKKLSFGYASSLSVNLVTSHKILKGCGDETKGRDIARGAVTEEDKHGIR
jgi:hypothetical protein